jgi:hypothetical protein
MLTPWQKPVFICCINIIYPGLLSAAQASFDGTSPVMQTRKERENMSEAKPKIEGAKKFRRPMRAAGQPTKKEFGTKV